jgi:Domain of unknown function (DUF932)
LGFYRPANSARQPASGEKEIKMLTEIQIDHEAPAVTAPYKVDVSRGTRDGTLSAQWASRPADQRFLNLADLSAKLRARADRTTAQVVKSREIEFIAPEKLETIEDMHKLSIGLPGGTEVAPTHWSFGQLSSLADFSAKELRKLPTPLVADILTHQMRYAHAVDDFQVFHDADQIASAVGTGYGWIPDANLVDAVRQIAGNGTGDRRWKIPGVLNWRDSTYDPFAPVTIDSTTLYASDRDVCMFLCDDTHPIEIGKLSNGEPDYIFRGFLARNSEVGAGTCSIRAFYLRGVCMNRNLWGVENMTEILIRHTSQAPARFIAEVAPALLSFADGGTRALVEGVEKAKALVVAKREEEALAFLQERAGFTKRRAREIAALNSEDGGPRGEGDFPRTIWDFSQSITAFARSIPNTDTRLEIEKVAGRLLDKVA